MSNLWHIMFQLKMLVLSGYLEDSLFKDVDNIVTDEMIDIISSLEN